MLSGLLWNIVLTVRRILFRLKINISKQGGKKFLLKDKVIPRGKTEERNV